MNISRYTILLSSLVLFSSVVAYAKPLDITVAVSPGLSDAIRESLEEDFAHVIPYEIGASSQYLLLIESSNSLDYGFFGAAAVTELKLTLLNSRGRRVATVENDRGRSNEDKFKRGYRNLIRDAKDALSEEEKEIDWFNFYNSIYVSKAINQAANVEAANFQDLLHYYVSFRDSQVVDTMLPYLDAYGGDYPAASNLEYYQDNEVFGTAQGNTLIHTAAFAGNIEIFDKIYARDPDLGKENDLGMTPVDIAIAALNFKLYLHMLDLDYDQASARANSAFSFLSIYANSFEPYLENYEDRQLIKADIARDDPVIPTILGRLLEAGADINFDLGDGLRPAHIAALSDNASFLDYLFEQEADISVVSGDKWNNRTPLSMAIGNNKEEAAFTLLDMGASPDRSVGEVESPLVLAIRKSDEFMATALLSYGAAVGVSANAGSNTIVEAIDAGMSYEMVDALLMQGAEVDTPDILGRTPLQAALSQDKQFIARRLLIEDVDVNFKGANGLTPLHTAVTRKQPGLIEALLNSGANPNATDGRGNTPLHYAYPDGSQSIQDSDYEIISQLVDNGADRSLTNFDGYTAEGTYQTQRDAFIARQAEIERQRQARILAQQRAEEERRRAAEVRRQQQQRQMAEARRRKQNSFQWGKLGALAIGAVAAGGLEMDIASQADFITNMVADSMPGVQGASNTTSGAYAIQARRAEESRQDAARKQAAAYRQRSVNLRPDILAAAGDRCTNNNAQVQSMCQAAGAYYNRYTQLAQDGQVEAANSMYQQYEVQAKQAMRYMQNAQKTSADTVLTAGSPSNSSRSPQPDYYNAPSGPIIDPACRSETKSEAWRPRPAGERRSISLEQYKRENAERNQRYLANLREQDARCGRSAGRPGRAIAE